MVSLIECTQTSLLYQLYRKGAESESSSRSTSSLKRKRKGARTKNQGRLAKRIHLVDSDINSNTFNADLNASDTDTGSVICIDSNTDSESTHARQSVTLKRLDKPGTRRSKKGTRLERKGSGSMGVAVWL